jgi:RNA polymerase sigma factor (sigma-70 family)
MFRRSEGRRSRHTAADMDMEKLVDKQTAEKTLLIDTELRERLYACVSELQPRDRMIVGLHLEAMTHRDISEVVGVSENHVGVLLHRLKPVLKKCITGEENDS